MRPTLLPGLRVRLVVAFVVVSALTIVVVALALLSPLKTRLRNDEIEGLRHTGTGVRAVLATVPSRELHPRSRALEDAVRDAAERVDAQVVVVSRTGEVLGSSVNRPGTRTDQARAALTNPRPATTVTGDDSAPLATYAGRSGTGRRRVGFAVSKPLDEVATAINVVRRAVVVASLAGLAAALAMGLVVATRLVQRLRALRDTALRVSAVGPTVQAPADRTADEVGDLSRAFSTMEEHLRRQEDARRTFVSTASHELRTPLSSLRLMLDLAREELGRTSPQIDTARTEVDRAARQAERLASLADELLDLSRIDAGVTLERRRVDLKPLAEAVAREFAARDGAREHRVDVAAEPGVVAYADPRAIVQVMRIALDNALRFSPPGEHVAVEVARMPEGSAIRVRDHGPGIPPAEREVVFERFRRGADTGGDGGFGLGLAIGRELARRMDGDLSLQDADRGTCLELRLPVAPAP